jgi:hypothetical protein
MDEETLGVIYQNKNKTYSLRTNVVIQPIINLYSLAFQTKN